MNEEELCQKRLLDLSKQADLKGIVLFSDFLNLNELNIFHSLESKLYTKTKVYGGYDGAERQMIAFIPDALSYEWNYPIACVEIKPQYPKFSEKLSHRDILGSIMNLGVERSKFGDIICKHDCYYLFCDEVFIPLLCEQLTKIRHTIVTLNVLSEQEEFQVEPEYEESNEQIASNRIDCIIAKVYHFSRSEASTYLLGEKVFVNGKCITNCNQSCNSGAIISVRGKGRFCFETTNGLSKKGKLIVHIKKYI